MADAVKPNPLRFGFVGTDQPDDVKQQRPISGEAWRIELTTPRTIMESYKVLRVGPAEIPRPATERAKGQPAGQAHAREREAAQ